MNLSDILKLFGSLCASALILTHFEIVSAGFLHGDADGDLHSLLSSGSNTPLYSVYSKHISQPYFFPPPSTSPAPKPKIVRLPAYTSGSGNHGNSGNPVVQYVFLQSSDYVRNLPFSLETESKPSKGNKKNKKNKSKDKDIGNDSQEKDESNDESEIETDGAEVNGAEDNENEDRGEVSSTGTNKNPRNNSNSSRPSTNGVSGRGKSGSLRSETKTMNSKPTNSKRKPAKQSSQSKPRSNSLRKNKSKTNARSKDSTPMDTSDLNPEIFSEPENGMENARRPGTAARGKNSNTESRESNSNTGPRESNSNTELRESNSNTEFSGGNSDLGGSNSFAAPGDRNSFAGSGGRNSGTESSDGRNFGIESGGGSFDSGSGGRNFDIGSGGRNIASGSGGRNAGSGSGGRNAGTSFGGRNTGTGSGGRNAGTGSGGSDSGVDEEEMELVEDFTTVGGTTRKDAPNLARPELPTRESIDEAIQILSRVANQLSTNTRTLGRGGNFGSPGSDQQIRTETGNFDSKNVFSGNARLLSGRDNSFRNPVQEYGAPLDFDRGTGRNRERNTFSGTGNRNNEPQYGVPQRATVLQTQEQQQQNSNTNFDSQIQRNEFSDTNTESTNNAPYLAISDDTRPESESSIGQPNFEIIRTLSKFV